MKSNSPLLRRRASFETLEGRCCCAADMLTVRPEAATTASPLASYQQATAGELDLVHAHWALTGIGQTVAVIDSGIAYDHRALGAGFGAGKRIVGGWDFAENDADPYDDPPGGYHGTHIAGILSSSDPAHPGVAAGADLVALRVMDDRGQCSFAWVEQALVWVHEHRFDFASPITTVNLSLGAALSGQAIGNGTSLEAALAQLQSDGIFVVAAAGNDYESGGPASLNYPASSGFVVAAESVDSQGYLSDFSQRSSRALAAAGEQIESTVPDYAGNVNHRGDDWLAVSGTSMATPFVAGAAVLVRQALQRAGQLSVSPDLIYRLLWDSADLLRDAASGIEVHRVNLLKAVEAAQQVGDIGDSPEMAASLGAGQLPVREAGRFQRPGDWDYYSFTADAAQRVRIVVQTAGGGNVCWSNPGGLMFNAREMVFDVDAGRRYCFGLGCLSGGEDYVLSFSVAPFAAPNSAARAAQPDAVAAGAAPQNPAKLSAISIVFVSASPSDRGSSLSFRPIQVGLSDATCEPIRAIQTHSPILLVSPTADVSSSRSSRTGTDQSSERHRSQEAAAADWVFGELLGSSDELTDVFGPAIPVAGGGKSAGSRQTGN